MEDNTYEETIKSKENELSTDGESDVLKSEETQDESESEGLPKTDLEELIQLGKGLANGIPTFSELDALVEYFKQAGLDSIQGDLITWEQLADIIGHDWVDVLKEGGKVALGIKAIETAMKGVEAYREHPELFEAVIDAAHAAKDSIEETSHSAYQELLNANEDGTVTMNELVNIALKYSYNLVADIANSSGGQYLIDELLKAAGIDPNNIVQDVLFLVIRKVMGDIKDPIGKQGGSSATQEFILSTLPLILGSEVWEQWTGYLTEMAPVLDMYFTFGLSIYGALAQAVEEGAMQALSAMSDLKYRVKDTWFDIVNGLADLFNQEHPYPDNPEPTYSEEQWRNLIHANVWMEEVGGTMWTFYSLGSFSIAIAADPFNEAGTAIRWQYYTTVSWEVRNTMVKAAASFNSMVKEFKTIIKAATVIPGKQISIDALQNSIFSGENRIKGKMVEAINEWAPIIGKRAAVLVVGKMLRWLALLAYKGINKLVNKVVNKVKDLWNRDKPSLPDLRLQRSIPERSPALTPSDEGDVIRRRRIQSVQSLYPLSVEPWLQTLQEEDLDE